MIGALLGNWRIAGIGALAATALIYHLFALDAARREGRDNAYSEMTRKTEEIADAAERARSRVRICVASGGVWQSDSRECRRSP